MLFLSSTPVSTDDYNPVLETLTFSQTTTRLCTDVTVNNDNVLEGEEDFNLILTTDDTMVALDPDMATVRINDTDRKQYCASYVCYIRTTLSVMLMSSRYCRWSGGNYIQCC